MPKQDIEGKKRELREKIEKHVNQLPLRELFKIYLYIQWYRFREKLLWLAWHWFMFQWRLDEKLKTRRRRQKVEMALEEFRAIVKQGGG
jgi:hypothetical protein